MATIADRVNAVLLDRILVEQDDLRQEASLEVDLGMDEYERLEFMMALEEAFGIVKIPFDHVERIRTVADAVAYVEKRLPPAAA